MVEKNICLPAKERHTIILPSIVFPIFCSPRFPLNCIIVCSVFHDAQNCNYSQSLLDYKTISKMNVCSPNIDFRLVFCSTLFFVMVMFEHWKSFKRDGFEMFMGEQEINMKSVIEHGTLVRTSEYSKFENFRKLLVLAQILSFLQKLRI